MIIHKLILQHLGTRDNEDFYELQARDAVRWIERKGALFSEKTKVLDLGCGHGIFGLQLMKRGCHVTFADDQDTLLPEISKDDYRSFSIGRDDLATLGQYDVVLFSNVLEHLAKPEEFLRSARALLTPGGFLFLSWTNWLSPWGGHEFSPLHYLGAHRGHLVYDKLKRRKRIHTPFQNLFPTYIGRTLRLARSLPDLRVVACAPRYYSEFAFITRLPILREFLTWNCALLLQRNDGQNQPGS